MAKGIELTKEQACKNPECFLYIWANDDFLNAIDPKYAKIIFGKRANQRWLLKLSAEKFLGSMDKVGEYYEAIRQAFIYMYGMTPAAALDTLASGGEVAGKNWSEGVYGIGALRTDFNGFAVEDKPITVDTATGHIYWGTEDITDESKTVKGTVGKNTINIQYFSKDIGTGYIFMSQYNKLQKKYYAASYADGQYTYSAKNGKEINASDSSNIWGNIELNWDWIKNIINWILSIFGISPIPSEDGASSTLTASNTLPNQKTDGFVSKAGTSETGVLLLCAAAAGYLLMGKKGKKYKANK